MVAASSPFAAVTAMGALIAPAQFARIAAAALPDQSADAYGVPKGLTLRDELARFFRIGQAQWRTFSGVETPSLGATTRFVEGLLRDCLGYSDLGRLSEQVTVGGRSFPIALMAGAVPIAIAPAADAIDRPSDSLSAQGRRRSAATLMQEYLNADAAALWGLASNGRSLRLVRDNPSLTRPAFIEFDLAAIFDDEAYADFAAMFLTLHRSRFAANDETCLLEAWRSDGAKAGAVARNKLRDGVEAALLLLGQGFLENPGNSALAERLRSGSLSLADYYAALLRLVYRLIFLLAAEDRSLLHDADASIEARQLYARGYSLGRLRDRAVRRAAWDRHHDAWEGLCIVMRALGRGEPRLGLPALGGLFDHDSLPDLEGATLANSRLLEAIYRLAWLRETSGPVPVNWRDMESEELGSVYEGLLELVPRLERGGAEFKFATDLIETKGNARKTSGSYYTPDSLVQALLDSSLTPLLDATVSGADEPAAALLSLRVVDPACGSGHFLLAAARRIAVRLAAVRTGGSPAPDDYRHALREVVSASIHGVDRNPMAVELTKVALWIESVEPGKPLGLLDANIRCGDALLGLDDLSVLENGIPDGAYAQLTGDDKVVSRDLRNINRAERDRPLLSAAIRPKHLAMEAAVVRAMPEETLSQVEAKRRALAALMSSTERDNMRRAADAWVAAFLAPKRVRGLVPTTRAVWEALGGGLPAPLANEIRRLARSARVFHWPLEFPAVLAGEKPGFDLVIGNPPWERIKLQEQEFFAARDPDIAGAPNAAARRKRIVELANADEPSKRTLYAEFETAKRTAEASSAFARVGSEGRFPLTGRGDVNTYALFAELFSRLLSRRGMAGVIVPTGIATDDGTRVFFSTLMRECKLRSLWSMYEVRQWFPATDDRKSFCLITIGSGNSDPMFAFDLRRIDDISVLGRSYSLSAEQIAKINPNTLTAPVFRSQADSSLVSQIYNFVPILSKINGDVENNPWGISFMTMFHMANESGVFRTAEQLQLGGFERTECEWLRDGDVYVPLYEAKMLHLYNDRWATYENGKIRDLTLGELSNTSFSTNPYYWIPKKSLDIKLSSTKQEWLMGWRDIALSSVERTVICSVLPRVGVNHKFPLFFVKHDPSLSSAFLANLSSIVLDYVARQKLGGTSLTYFYLRQFPILPPSAYSVNDLDFIVPRVLELTYTSHAMAPFARDLGFTGPPFAWNEDRRAQLRAELDAWFARAYGLTRDQLRYVLDPADVMGVDYPSETFRVLKKNDIARFGDYRTARLTLAAWDAQARGA